MHTNHRLAASLTAAALLLGAAPLALAGTAAAASAAGPTAVKFTCKAKNATTCVVRIPLKSHMDEQVGSTMPNRTHPWYLHLSAGSTGTGGYGLSGPGAPDTYWDGKSGGTQGYVWSANLTTGKETSGGYASLTFAHVKVVAKRYTSFTASYPSTAATGSIVLITSAVHPVPPKGHLLVQRRDGSTWKNVVSCTYSAKTKKWSSRFRWTYPAHTTKKFRLYAKAAPGLLATPGGTFTISTSR